MYLAYDTQKVYVSKDFITWSEMFSADYQNLNSITSVYERGGTYVMTAAGTRTDELYTSTDDGATWGRVPVIHNYTQLHKVFPVNGSTYLDVQQGYFGYWFLVSRDGGKSWVNTTTKAPSVELAWFSNSKAVIHLSRDNVTAAAISDLTTWTTQKMAVNSAATWLVFKDMFYALDHNRTWSSSDGVSWTLSDQPYYTQAAHNWGVNDDTLMGVGNDGVSITATQQ